MKNKKIKIIIISFICVLLIAIVAFVGISILNQKEDNNETLEVQKEEMEEQEPIYEKDYSMHNGDIFVKVGNTIGYINKLDNSTQIINVESGETIQVKTPERGLEKLYFDGKNMYGVPSHYVGKGIYKIDLQGNVSKIYEGECVQLWLTDDKIYFIKQNGFDEINQTPQGDLCYMDKYGKNITTIISNVKNYFRIQDNTIYYTDLSTRGLYKVDIDGNNKQLLAEGRTYITGINKDYIVYVDYADGESYHVLYFDDNTNHKVGRFGNSYVTNKIGYIYTRKLTGKNNEIDVTFSLLKIDAKNKTEEQIQNTEDMARISYVYKKNVYFTGSNIIKYNLKDNTSESMDIRLAQFLDGKAYEFKMDGNQKVIQVIIYDLENNENKKVALNYKDIVQETKVEEKAENITSNENSNKYTLKEENETNKQNATESEENKTPITKEEAIKIWKENIPILGANNNIIDYENYTFMLNISQAEVKPNTLFTQSDNLPERQSSNLRKVWKIETSDSIDALQMLDVYIDIYTGQIIGGRIYGD